MKKLIKISELSNISDCTVETIRYYEHAGLLPEPLRTAGNYRMYDEKHIERLRFIRHCRYLDMTLDEIRQLLKFCDAPQENCGEVNALLDEHIGHVGERITELQQLEKQLKNLRRLCRRTQAAKDCGILQELANTSGSTTIRDDRPSHVHGAHGRGRRSYAKSHAR